MTSPEEPPDPQPAIANLPLWKSFSVGLFGSIFFAVVIAILLNYSRAAIGLDLSESTTTIIGWVIFLPFYLVVMVSLWKCAYNTSRPFLGYLARGYTVVSTLFLVAIFVTIMLE